MDASEICELIDGVVGRMDRETTGSTLLRCGDMEKHTDACYAWDGVLFLAEALKREVKAREDGRMSEFRWHLTTEERPREGKGNYVIIGPKGGMYFVTEYVVLGEKYGPGEWFKDTRGNHHYPEEVKAWAEIPPLEVDE